jgi:hypothetical protein
MKKKLFLLAFISLLSFNIDLKAQPPDPGGGGELPNCFPPPCVPIDGGLSWLLIAGAAYGGKKYLDINKKEEEI